MSFEEAYSLLRRGHTEHEKNGVGIVRLPAFSACPEIEHGFSMRTGGVSTGCFASLNLSYTHDDAATVTENYRRFADAAGFPFGSMVMDSYEHGVTVRVVTDADCGKGYLRDPLPPCDGLVTQVKGVTLITGHADCMAFFFYDPVCGRIGLCHAGWRGALGKIGLEVLKTMAGLGSDPKDILCGVGPSICPKCFEVGEDVAELFENAFPGVPLRGVNERGRPKVDLWQAALSQFLEGGARAENVSLMDMCTKEDPRFYSFRREGRTGGMAAYLRLRCD